ncbi:hypothetical protein RND81_12G047600 [Saponaria officinalis]|uniref:NDH-dependent cyclic electron flow 5 n=1 Tax=Saponaria officinalis TaxID=3572 RepID=A0AAW1H798_SAPOF
MSSSALFSSNTSPLNATNHSKAASFPSTPTPKCITFSRRDTALPISVTSPSVSYPQPQPEPSFNVDYLEREFGSHGVSFKGLGQSYVIKMILENGSAVSVLLPSGLVTSYKPKMWHGSSVEVLHTSVSEDQAGNPVIQGGVSLSFDFSDNEGFSWSPSTWLLNDVQGSPQESIQVEMISRDVSKMVEVKHMLSLTDDSLKSEIIISTINCSQLKLKGSILNHLNVSTPEATYAIGLEGSNFFDREPLNSNFCIIPPDTPKAKKADPRQLLPLTKLFSAKNDDGELTVEMDGEENDNYKHLTDKMSRIYKFAPRNFTIIDRGRRNSVNVGRKGFEEVYLYSPGSTHESYGKYSYICVGQLALLKPVSLRSDQIWTGGQLLHNPNL